MATQDLAAATSAEAAKSDTGMRLGVVKSVASSGAMVAINGATVGPYACVGSYVPTPGDNVAIIRQGASWLVLGTSAAPSVSGSASSVSLLLGWTASVNHVSRVALGSRPAALIICVMTPGGTKSDGSTIGTLPSGMRPKSSFDLPGVANVTVSAGQTPHFGISSSGAMVCWGFGSATYASITQVFPLDV